jgi:hypothetical protein
MVEGASRLLLWQDAVAWEGASLPYRIGHRRTPSGAGGLHEALPKLDGIGPDRVRRAVTEWGVAVEVAKDELTVEQ